MKNFRSGLYIQQGYYKSFQPNLINRLWTLENMEIQKLLGQANRELGKLDMYSEYIPNIDLFISMHVLKEATQSSKIEGTQTNIEEALLDSEAIVWADIIFVMEHSHRRKLSHNFQPWLKSKRVICLNIPR
jgi:Fic/DOC family N-terminal